jgi:hypothetical protein
MREKTLITSYTVAKMAQFLVQSCQIAFKIAFPKEILLNVQPGAARIVPSSIEKSLY